MGDWLCRHVWFEAPSPAVAHRVVERLEELLDRIERDRWSGATGLRFAQVAANVVAASATRKWGEDDAFARWVARGLPGVLLSYTRGEQAVVWAPGGAVRRSPRVFVACADPGVQARLAALPQVSAGEIAGVPVVWLPARYDHWLREGRAPPRAMVSALQEVAGGVGRVEFVFGVESPPLAVARLDVEGESEALFYFEPSAVRGVGARWGGYVTPLLDRAAVAPLGLPVDARIRGLRPGWEDRPEVRSAVLSELAAADPATRAAAAAAVRRFGWVDEGSAAGLVALLDDPDPACLAAAMRALVVCGAPADAGVHVGPHLEHENPVLRALALRVASRAGAVPAAAIAAGLVDAEGTVRSAACAAARLDRPEELAGVARCAGDLDEDVADAALGALAGAPGRAALPAAALRRWGKAALEPLLRADLSAAESTILGAMSHEEAAVRRGGLAAARALGLRGPAISGGVRAVLGDADPWVRTTAVEVLGGLVPDPENIARLRALAADERLAKPSFCARLRLGDPEAHAALAADRAAYLGDPQRAWSWQGPLAACASHPGSWSELGVADAAESLLAAPQAMLREIGLERLEDPTRLAELLRTAEDAGVRQRAAQRLGELAGSGGAGGAEDRSGGTPARSAAPRGASGMSGGTSARAPGAGGRAASGGAGDMSGETATRAPGASESFGAAVAALAEALDDADGEVAATALRALFGLGEAAQSGLRRALGSRRAGLRAVAAIGLAWSGARLDATPEEGDAAQRWARVAGAGEEALADGLAGASRLPASAAGLRAALIAGDEARLRATADLAARLALDLRYASYWMVGLGRPLVTLPPGLLVHRQWLRGQVSDAAQASARAAARPLAGLLAWGGDPGRPAAAIGFWCDLAVYAALDPSARRGAALALLALDAALAAAADNPAWRGPAASEVDARLSEAT